MRDRGYYNSLSSKTSKFIHFFPFHYPNFEKPSSIFQFLSDAGFRRNPRERNSNFPFNFRQIEALNGVRTVVPKESVTPVLNSNLLAPFPVCGKLDTCSDGVSIPSTEFIEVDGKQYPVYFKNKNHKRVVLSWPVSINNSTFSALVDTGATISAINLSLLNKLPPSIFRLRRIEPFSVNLSVEDTEHVVIKEQAEIVVSVDDVEFLWSFYIVPSLTNQLVFGMDWLTAMEVNICCHAKSIQINRRIMPPRCNNAAPPSTSLSLHVNGAPGSESQLSPETDCESHPSVNNASPLSNLFKIMVRRTSIIKPLSFTKVMMRSSKRLNSDVLFSPIATTDASKQIGFGACLINFKDGLGATYVMNLSKRPFRLRENTVIGTCSLFDDSMTVCNMDTLAETTCNSSVSESLSKLNEIHESVNPEFEKLKPHFKFSDCLSEEEKSRLLVLLKRFTSTFSSPDSPKMGRCPLVEHKIDVGDSLPIKQRPYRVSFKEREILNNEIDKLFQNNLIEHSQSPWSSPVVLVRKPNGGIRCCIDYRKLNRITKKDSYPLPRIDDALDRLRGARYFSTLDCDQAFHQIEVEENSKDKTAFVTPDGLYQYKVLPFGLSSSPATFQRLIDSVLGRFKWTIALVYMDDVIIFSNSFEDHIKHLETVLSAIKKSGLVL